MIDDLRYTYSGNQLQAVRDQSTQHGDKDFQDHGATSFQDYTYDTQGSLTSDANQGITAVTYNHLGLTETVTLTGGRQLRYLYAADGTRLARVRVQPGQADLRDDLVGDFAYQGGVLNHILTSEGRVVPAISPGRQYRHEYHYRDQLGNLRLAFSDLNNNGIAEVGGILQEAHYYPYGLGFSGLPTVSNGMASRYTFNGKEAQEAFGLAWVDFDARMYDAQVGRWTAVDPLGDQRLSYSPYAFVSNDPISRVDPDGRLDYEYDQNGRKISDLGGEKIHFYHLKNGDTRVVNASDNSSNIITDGESFIRGFVHRDRIIHWAWLYYEFRDGFGPVKSMISNFDNTTYGPFGSLDNINSTYASKARADATKSQKSKGFVTFDYLECNPLTALFDGWEQFWGRSNVSWYDLGNQVLFVMLDSKSMTSYGYRVLPSHERSDSNEDGGNTYQTYIWTEPKTEVITKTLMRDFYFQQQMKKNDQMIKSESIPRPSRTF